MKRPVLYIAAAVMSFAFACASYADVISDAPYAISETETAPVVQETTAASASVSTAGTKVVDAPDASGTSSGGTSAPAQTGTASSSSASSAVTAAGPGNSGSAAASTAAGPGAGSTSGSTSGTNTIIAPPTAASSDTSSSAGVPGSDHANDPKTRVELGFTVVSPNFEYNGFKVAEGSVQLSDGSWETLDHSKYVRQPYFRLLREDGDWYVVSVHATRIGNYYSSDGTTFTELWLKKSECTAKNYIELNTSNATRAQIVKEALSMLGKGYRYAGNGPDYFDCSGFVNAIMTDSGISIARTSSEICNAGTSVGITGLRPGDIVGRSGHVGIYIGDGYFVHAAESATGVVSEDVSVYNQASSAFTSFVNVVGD